MHKLLFLFQLISEQDIFLSLQKAENIFDNNLKKSKIFCNIDKSRIIE